jgi:hypothetical protein
VNEKSGWKLTEGHRHSVICFRIPVVGRGLFSDTINQATRIWKTQFSLGVVGDGRASAMAIIKPGAAFARLDLQPAKGIKYRGIFPDKGKRLLGQFSCKKVPLLKKCARINLAHRRNTTGQFARPTHIKTQRPPILGTDGKKGITRGNVHVFT